MKLNRLFPIVLSLLLAACASTNNEVADYNEPLIAPAEIEEFVMIEKKAFDEPMLGTMLKYQNKDFPDDNISVYVYPINAVSWKDEDKVMSSELAVTLAQIDEAIKQGYYKSRSPERLSDFDFTTDDKEYKGKKAEFTLTVKQGVMFYSDAYVFVDEDKYIKFRTSFNSQMAARSVGDFVVKSILPQLNIPPESAHMKKVRAAHAEKLKEQLMQMLLNSMNTSTKEETSELSVK